jgi:hypothetical protein
MRSVLLLSNFVLLCYAVFVAVIMLSLSLLSSPLILIRCCCVVVLVELLAVSLLVLEMGWLCSQL